MQILREKLFRIDRQRDRLVTWLQSRNRIAFSQLVRFFRNGDNVYTCVFLVILTPCFTIQAQKQEGKKDVPSIKLTKAVHNIYLVVNNRR